MTSIEEAGGPNSVKFTEAISLFVSCKTPEEVDELWEKLSEGRSVQQCGCRIPRKSGIFRDCLYCYSLPATTG